MNSAYLYRRCRCLGSPPLLRAAQFWFFPSTTRYKSSDRAPQNSTRKDDDFLLPQANEEVFCGDSGFWPASSESPPPNHKSLDPPIRDAVTLKSPIPPRADSAPFFTPLLPSVRHNKYDLSNLDPMIRWSRDEARTTSSPFRAGQGFRAIMVNYATLVEPRFRDLESNNPYLESDLYQELHTVFQPHVVEYLEKRNYEPEDVVSWSWVVTAPNISHSIRRYIALVDDLRRKNKPLPPRWIPLQILRVEYINPTSFTSLVSVLLQEAQEHPQQRLQTFPDDDGPHLIEMNSPQARSREWNVDSSMVLAVRLIRHARNVAPSTFDDIIGLVSMWLFRKHYYNDPERLAFGCNRLLSLLSLPCYVKPFRSVGEQQKAQLSLLRRMMAQDPPAELSREGYRALIKVQLVQEKTEQEQRWAEAKSKAWPPWRRSKTGMEDQMTYSGQESRAMKMLRRMNEAGYSHGPWEQAASVLAGWDTDRSPTIQTRRILKLPSLAPTSAGDMVDGQEEIPDRSASLWTSRITATRSVREAWSCFMTYRDTVEDKKNELGPYQAMFEKLLARPQVEDANTGILSGDAIETFADPVSSSELLYLQKDVPSAKEFYGLMLSDDIQPAGRLLSLLLRNAQSLDEGIQYIKDSRFSEMRKDVLLNAGNYPDLVRRDTFSSLPRHFFLAFLDFLFRSGLETFNNIDKARQSRMEIEWSENYAVKVIWSSETRYLPAYNTALVGLLLRLKSGGYGGYLSNTQLRPIWWKARTLVARLHEQGVEANMETFHKFGSIACIYLKGTRSKWRPRIADVCNGSKMLFTRAAYGNKKYAWLPAATNEPLLNIPDPEHVRLLVEILGIIQDTDGILEVAIWTCQHAKKLNSSYKEMRSGERKMKRALLVLRVFLEGFWAVEGDWEAGIRVATEEQLASIEQQMSGLPWPSAEDVEEFLSTHCNWVADVRQAIWNTKRMMMWKQTENDQEREQKDGNVDEVAEEPSRGD